MDEAKAYQWAVQALRNCNGEQHKREQCAELVVAAIRSAYNRGYCMGEGYYLEFYLKFCDIGEGSDVKNTANDG